MFRVPLAALCVLLVSSSSFAQVFYEPVKYQHGGQNKFYYGGTDPRLLEYADGPRSGSWGRVHGFHFISGNVQTHRAVDDEPARIYSDAVPFENARIYGFTEDDARNEAYANVPTYFRKSDLLAYAVATPGGWVVPAHAGSGARVYYPEGIEMRFTPPGTRPSTSPRPLMIIPKAKRQGTRLVAKAR
jgi:hypothetical protein